MSLLFRINLVLVAVFAVAATLTGLALRAVLQMNAQREIRAEAQLMIDSALAARDYTASEVAPLLHEQMQHEFLPQSVAFYAATEHFLRLRASRPDYSYQEATLNPMNPRDRATDWQADIIQRFRNDPGMREFAGERDTPLGRSLYLARPIRASADCLPCHSVPAQAPPTLLARYGSNNGFGWQVGEVIGAQVVSVPIAHAEASAARAFGAFLAALASAFVALLIIVNAVLYTLVVRPVRRMAAIADRLSVGDNSAPDFPSHGGAEIAALGTSFNRMRRSLDKALRMLETQR